MGKGTAEPLVSARIGWQLLAGAAATNGVMLVIMSGLASLFGTALQSALAAQAAAGLVSQGMMLMAQRSGDDVPDPRRRGDRAMVSVVAAALLYALGAGFCIGATLLPRSDDASAQAATANAFVAFQIAGLVVCLLLQAAWFVVAQRYAKLDVRAAVRTAIAGLPVTPERPVLLIEMLAALATTVIALVASGVVSVSLEPWGDIAAAVCIVAILVGVSLLLALQVRRLIAGTVVSEAEARAVIACIGRAANQTGSIRRVLDVDAVHLGPDGVVARVQLAFKDGVSAHHVAGVVAKLRAGVQAELPYVDVVLAAPQGQQSAAKEGS